MEALKVIGKDNPDSVEVPPMHVFVLTETPEQVEPVKRLVQPLAGKPARDWFHPHFYKCLPLTIANQYGFVVPLETDTTITWDGSDRVEGLVIEQAERAPDAVQRVRSFVGWGVFLVDMPMMLRTPKGVNLMVGTPPNYFVDGLSWIAASVETDQLRTDFTFNLRVTRPGTIHLKAGTPVGHFMPIPRYFADKHALVMHPEDGVLEKEREAYRDFYRLRHGAMKGAPGGLYRRGYDQYGNELPDHQRK